jgi:putative Ca2+/H+ antiporter (TMEM165/GDT1 family)
MQSMCTRDAVIDFVLFAYVFGIIFVAELPDKTALASLFLAVKNPPFPVFLGASLALTVQSIVAVSAGSLIALLPAKPVHVVSGVVFLVAAVMMWRRHEDDAPVGEAVTAPKRFWPVVGEAFGVVFIAEWGDLTQVGTAALAARFHAPVTVFLGATTALWAVVAIAVFIGHKSARLLNPDLTKKVAACVFAGIGAALIAGWL